MSIGLSLFFSVLLISIIYLAQKFPEKIKWKKILKVLFFIFIILPLISLLCIYCYGEYKNYKEKIPTQITEYWDIKLDETLEDVRFIKGVPNNKFNFSEASLIHTDNNRVEVINDKGTVRIVPIEKLTNFLNGTIYSLPNNHHSKNQNSRNSPTRGSSLGNSTYVIWEYEDQYKEAKHLVHFTNKNIVRAISCFGDQGYLCPSIASICIGSSYDEITKIFGLPPYGYTDFEDGRREACYPQYNSCFSLSKSKVHSIMVKTWGAQDYYIRGMTVYNGHKVNKYGDALKAFDQAIKINPNYAEAYDAKGMVLYNLNKYDEAIEAFDHAIRLGLRSADIYNMKGLTLYCLDKDQEAIKSFDAAIMVDPRYSAAYSNKGRIFSRTKKYEDAIIAYDKAIMLEDHKYFKSMHLHKKGLCLTKLNKYEDAVKAYNESIAANTIDWYKSHNNYTYHDKGIALLALGKRKEAIECITKAIALDPTNPKFQDTLRSINTDGQ